MDDDSVDTLLLGKTGNGKSAVGNSIVRAKKFLSSASMVSETKEMQSAMADFNGKSIKVIDGPGVGDTQLSKSERFEQMQTWINRAIYANPKGYHAIIIVVKYGARFTDEEVEVLAFIKQTFGENFLRDYCVVVMTCGDCFQRDMEDSDMTFDTWCRDQEGAFATLLEECCGRIVLFDNYAKGQVRDAQIEELLATIGKLKKGRYTDEKFAKAAEERKRAQVALEKPRVEQEIDKATNQILTNSIQIQETSSLKEGDDTTQKLTDLIDRCDDLIKIVNEADKETGVLADVEENVQNVRGKLEASLNSHRDRIQEFERSIGETEEKVEKEMNDMQLGVKNEKVENEGTRAIVLKLSEFVTQCMALEELVKARDSGSGRLKNLETKLLSLGQELQNEVEIQRTKCQEREEMVMNVEAEISEEIKDIMQKLDTEKCVEECSESSIERLAFLLWQCDKLLHRVKTNDKGTNMLNAIEAELMTLTTSIRSERESQTKLRQERKKVTERMKADAQRDLDSITMALDKETSNFECTDNSIARLNDLSAQCDSLHMRIKEHLPLKDIEEEVIRKKSSILDAVEKQTMQKHDAESKMEAMRVEISEDINKVEDQFDRAKSEDINTRIPSLKAVMSLCERIARRIEQINNGDGHFKSQESHVHQLKSSIKNWIEHEKNIQAEKTKRIEKVKKELNRELENITQAFKKETSKFECTERSISKLQELSTQCDSLINRIKEEDDDTDVLRSVEKEVALRNSRINEEVEKQIQSKQHKETEINKMRKKMSVEISALRDEIVQQIPEDTKSKILFLRKILSSCENIHKEIENDRYGGEHLWKQEKEVEQMKSSIRQMINQEERIQSDLIRDVEKLKKEANIEMEGIRRSLSSEQNSKLSNAESIARLSELARRCDNLLKRIAEIERGQYMLSNLEEEVENLRETTIYEIFEQEQTREKIQQEQDTFIEEKTSEVDRIWDSLNAAEDECTLDSIENLKGMLKRCGDVIRAIAQKDKTSPKIENLMSNAERLNGNIVAAIENKQKRRSTLLEEFKEKLRVIRKEGKRAKLYGDRTKIVPLLYRCKELRSEILKFDEPCPETKSVCDSVDDMIEHIEAVRDGLYSCSFL